MMTELKSLIGKRVTGLSMSTARDVIAFHFPDSAALAFYTDGDCCSRSWIDHGEALARGYLDLLAERDELVRLRERHYQTAKDWAEILKARVAERDAAQAEAQRLREEKDNLCMLIRSLLASRHLKHEPDVVKRTKDYLTRVDGWGSILRGQALASTPPVAGEAAPKQNGFGYYLCPKCGAEHEYPSEAAACCQPAPEGGDKP